MFMCQEGVGVDVGEIVCVYLLVVCICPSQTI